MTAEAITYGALRPLAAGRVFPDVAPPKTPTPWIVYQAIGGQAFPTLDGSTPTTNNARMQVTVYSATRAEAVALMQDVVAALVNPTVKAVPIGAPVSSFEPDTQLRGSSLDFSITY